MFSTSVWPAKRLSNLVIMACLPAFLPPDYARLPEWQGNDRRQRPPGKRLLSRAPRHERGGAAIHSFADHRNVILRVEYRLFFTTKARSHEGLSDRQFVSNTI